MINKLFYAWNCHSGCGITTMMDKFLKGKRVYCANCGIKTEMVYLGEIGLADKSNLKHKLGLKT